MSEPLLDDLARRLARPMPRRRALAVLGGSVAALMLPSLRPRGAFGQSAEIVCTQPTQYCRSVTCPSSRICCVGPPDPSTISQCPTNPHCCDPCDPTGSRCLGDGSCGPGPVDPAACCASQGLQACGPSGLCCTPDQICDASRGICCPPEPDPPKCNEPAPDCQKRADELISRQKGSVDTGVSFGAEGALEGATAFAIFDLWSRYKEYDKCPQVPDDSDCATGGRCNPSTLRCRQCGDAGARVRHAVSASKASVDTRTKAPPAASAKRRVSRAELVRRLRARRAKRARVLRRLVTVTKAQRRGTRHDAELAKAFADSRREIVLLRSSLARGSGGAPQRYAVRMCDELARGLAQFQAAALEDDRAKAQALALAARTSIRPGIRRARRLRTVLGCGTRCL